MELALAIRSTTCGPGPPPWLGWAGPAPRDERERNKLRRFDVLWEPGADWRDVALSSRRSRPPDTSAADEAVGVEATVEGGGGGSGNWAWERRRELLEKGPGLNRPAVA
jgi:hypothetical protein